MSRPLYAIFTAGGSGTRMGAETPKQFMDLCGIPVLQRTIEKFVEAEPSTKVITVLPKAHMKTWKDLCLRFGMDVPQVLVEGGITRFHSVRNALVKVPDGAIVAVHDGVRPLFTPKLVTSMVSRMREGDVRALVPGVPVIDTLRSRTPGVPAPDRSSLVAVQTPQMFLSEVLKKAYGAAYDTSFTDDASVVERDGVKVDIFEGERFNIKLTTPEDMDLARLLISQN